MVSGKYAIRVIALLVILAVIAIATWLLRKPDTSHTIDPPDTAVPSLAVSVHTPVQRSIALQLSANGTVAAWQEAIIGSEHNGLRLTQVHVNVGETVRAGQVLAEFSPDMVKAQLAQAVAATGEARAAATEAAALANRARKLSGTGAMSQQQIEQAIAAEQTAQARLSSAQAAQDVQRIRERDLAVLAPDDGVISSSTATVGSVVPAGVELFRLIRQGRLEWRAELTAESLALLSEGQQAQLGDQHNMHATGTVRRIAPSLNPQTRMGLVYVDIHASLPHPQLKAGMFVRGDFLLGSTPATLVMREAVVPRDGFNHVFLVGDDNKVQQLRVQTGRLADGWMELKTPLPDNARVVGSGAGFLQHGDLVRVVQE